MVRVKKSAMILIVIGLQSLLVGCATYYSTFSIPDTKEGLAAYRDCTDGPNFYQALPCMAGIPGVESSGWLKGDEEQMSSMGSTISGDCRIILSGKFVKSGDTYWYKVLACHENNSPSGDGANTPSSYRDKDGILHIEK